MVATPWYPVPPSGYGGVELVCAVLVDALIARGHEVTLFGAGEGTGTAARFVATMPTLQYRRLGAGMPPLLHVARVNRRLAADHFNVVHDHSVAGALSAAGRSAPTVMTMHGPPVSEVGDFYDEIADDIHLVAISEAQRRQRPDLRWAGTVHNGVDPAGFRPRRSPHGAVLWLGRFCADKGPDLAVQACRAAGLPLVLAGKCNELAEQRYLDTTVRPLLHDGVCLILNPDRRSALGLLAAARCLILPIRWDEPFGMVMIEAMASGTPVVALRRGSVPEIVQHGMTGWICDDPAQLPEALRRVGELDIDACPVHVRRHFCADLMASRYEDVYRRSIAAQCSPNT
jgi:glycosyltransferase involved in cell wall biosynthesis